MKFIKERQIKAGIILCVHVVIKDALEISKNPKDHSVYFDSIISSYSLICNLATKGFRATGIMRNYRIMKCPLVDDKTMKKNKRGFFNFKSGNNIEILRWNDNPVVPIRSNAYGVQPIGSEKRWIKVKGKQSIQQSAVITAYN